MAVSKKQEPKFSPLVNKMNFIPQLSQLLNTTPDGDLISSLITEELERRGLVVRFDGYNVITPDGLSALIEVGVIN